MLTPAEVNPWLVTLRWAVTNGSWTLVILLSLAVSSTAAVAVAGMWALGLSMVIPRPGFGWAALVLAVIAAVGATLAPARPRLACATLVAGSSLGMVAMSLFDSNTFYVAALPLCWIATALALLGRRPTGTRELASE
jgi:hypothetical protein